MLATMNGALLYDLTKDQLTDLLTGWGEPTFRATQVREWLYKKLATHPSQMSNLPAVLRNRLAMETSIEPLERIYEQRSADRRPFGRLHPARHPEEVEEVGR